MHSGNSKDMKHCLFFILFYFFAGIRSFSQPSAINHSTLDETLRRLNAKDDAENFIYAFVDDFLVNPVESRLDVFEEFERSLWRPLRTNSEHLAYVILLCNKGYYLSQFGKLYQAIEAYEKAWEIHKTHALSSFDIIEYCLKPLGNNYTMLGDHSSAENIIKQYLFIAEKTKNYTHSVSACINLSIVYHISRKYHLAIRLLSRALELPSAEGEKKGIIYANLSKNYLGLDDLPRAKQCAEISIGLLQKYKTEETPLHLVNVCKILCWISAKEQDFKNAKYYLNKAENTVAKNSFVFKKREIAKLANDYGDVLKLEHELTKALQFYQKSLTQLLPSYQPRDATDLPDVSSFYAENTIKESLDRMANAYEEMDDLEKALSCYSLSFTVEDILRGTYNYQEAKLDQQIENRARSGHAITLLHKLAGQTKNEGYILRAFQLAERTKAIVLKESVEKSYRKLPFKTDSLLQKETNLTYKKARLAKDICEEQLKGNEANIQQINDLISKQTGVTIELKNLEKKIEKKYRFKKEYQPINIESLQQKLSQDHATLVEYFAEKNSLYLFRVDENSVALDVIEDAQKVYNDIYKLIDFFSASSAINNDVEAYKKTAVRLYSALQLQKTNSENLIVVPDGLLNYIPFEALLYSQAMGVNYASFPFLVKQHKITYQTSAALYATHAMITTSSKKEILGLFPTFENSERELPHSMLEAHNLEKLFSGKYLFKEEATKKSFVQNVGKYSIVHLATHADAGSLLKPPSISFFDSTLYLPEIYGLQISPSLVVTSACETGTGSLSSGEGPLSLARGFQFAGARNIILSLWNVNDNSTAALMSNFYANYKENEKPVDALRQAKLDYLQSKKISNNQKSPYYWAAFVYYGNVDIQEESAFYFYTLLFSVVGVATIIILWYYFSKVKANKRGAFI